MSSNNNSSGAGIGFLGLLTIAFIVLKLTKCIAWSWWWVLAPMWSSNAMRSICSKTGATAGDRASRRISPRSAACRSFTSRNMRPMRAACEQLAGALLRFTEAMRSCNSALRRYSAVMPKQRYKPLQGNRTRKTKRLTCLQRRRKKTN